MVYYIVFWKILSRKLGQKQPQFLGFGSEPYFLLMSHIYSLPRFIDLLSSF